ncbi:enoyl-CoA hydratase 2, peroxisomal [Heracleum sosnowskyi]|uniref:Enoyl-CoA hydratase 2, peroxisomal n=1 Tax=Heracleum sosnowskyi TaxID=360622 RepID=A0AAD8H8B9_9APIA|nr:enoyl-CoA hydratase 2, peroxisomal [Heracleum sosnowskyi]
MENTSLINPELVVNHKSQQRLFTYDERDVTLYALGIGACATNALDDKELKYVYHEDGQKFIKVLPTFATIYSLGSINIDEIPGMSFDPRLLLHGQQFIEIYKPLPTHGCIRNKTTVVGLHDKGKAAILELEVVSYGESSDEPICMNRLTLYLRGAGGFSKSPRPYSYTNYRSNRNLAFKHPKTHPFAVYEECTQPSQALVYRLSGDYNPLHSDPTFAGMAGFSRPILHGLCTLGFAVRAIIRCICGGDPDIVKSISGRLLLHVYPGETLITEMWLEGLSVMYQVKVKERSKTVLSGVVDLNRPASTL